MLVNEYWNKILCNVSLECISKQEIVVGIMQNRNALL